MWFFLCKLKEISIYSRLIEPQKHFKQWMTQTTLLFNSVASLPEPQRKRDFFLIVCFLLFFLFFLFQISPVQYKCASSPSSFKKKTFSCRLLLLFLCRLLSLLRLFLFLFSCSVCKWQLWEATVACWCHVNQIRCHNRKSVHMHGRRTVTHTHDLLPLQAKCRQSRHWYTDMNLLWVKGNCTLSQTASYLLQQIWHDSQSTEHFDQTSASMWKVTDSHWWFRDNSAPSFKFKSNICWLFS